MSDIPKTFYEMGSIWEEFLPNWESFLGGEWEVPIDRMRAQ